MEPVEREIRFYETSAGRVPCREWLDGLEQGDKRVYGVVMNRLDRVAAGNLGDCAPVGEGVSELRIDFGPGYRIYFGVDGDVLNVLLAGGTKSTQPRDITQAQEFWKDYHA